jgi:hypothetical protein
MSLSHGTVAYGKESKVLHVDRKTLGIEVFPDSSVLIKAPAGTDFERIQKIVCICAAGAVESLPQISHNS